MSALITLITPVVTYIFTVITTNILPTITESPYLMFTTGFLVVGGAIKVVRALLRK